VGLDGEAERRGEVARMLAGHTVTASALEHAGALIAAARPAPRAAARRPGAGGGASRRGRGAPAHA
jgi:DNA repair protein RecN (Recombination protein N)